MAKQEASRHAPGEVDAYLAALPEDVRTVLEELRSVIRDAAPECTERVSYGIPIFRLNKDLVGISAQKKHCSLHTMSPSLVEAMGESLSGVRVSGATLHFDPHSPLSRDLVERIVRARMLELKVTRIGL